MNVPFLDLGREARELSGELVAAVAHVLDGGRFVLGPAVAEFEAAWAAYCGVRHAVGVASGTDAIALALEAVGVEPGDEVVAPANTCAPTIVGIEAAGGVPVLADVDPQTLTLDPAAAAAAVTARTRAIVPVHLYGQCADIAAIGAVAREHGLRVVEDAAQAHGAELGGRRAGSLGDAAAFSFYPTKNLGALGDAGAVVTDDGDVAERARALRNYGERRRHESALRGRNSRLDELQAALLLVKLPLLDGWNDRRRALAAVYDAALEESELRPLVEPTGRRHAFHLYVARSERREELRAELASQGVETLVHYPLPVHRHPAYAHLARGDYPESEAACAEVVSLPLYPQLTDAEAEQVATVLRRVGAAAAR